MARWRILIPLSVENTKTVRAQGRAVKAGRLNAL